MKYPPCSYRVSVKGVILSDERLVLVREDSAEWDLPGGGVEHLEELEIAFKREIKEEINAKVKKIYTNKVQPWVTHDHDWDRPLLFLVYPVDVEKTEFISKFGSVQIGLFDKGQLGVVPLVKHIEKYRKNLIDLAFSK